MPYGMLLNGEDWALPVSSGLPTVIASAAGKNASPRCTRRSMWLWARKSIFAAAAICGLRNSSLAAVARTIFWR